MDAADAGIAVRLVPFADPDFALVSAVRRAVFIEEQQVSETDEWDGLDASSEHLLAAAGGRPAGTLRFYQDGGWLHVGRVAVLREYRGAGIGRLLMERCLAEMPRLGCRKSFLNAQSDKAGFYARLGYSVSGGEFMEAGIPHVRMELFAGE